MPYDTWESIPKNQTSNETIEQAIAAAILEHAADSASHLGDGESLQSHKSDTVIDHPAESVVNDKILKFSVDYSKVDYSQITYETHFETQDPFQISQLGMYSSFAPNINNGTIRAGNQVNNYCDLIGMYIWEGLDFSTQNFTFQVLISMPSSAYGELTIGIGNVNDDFVGFKSKSDGTYVLAKHGGNGTEENIGQALTHTAVLLAIIVTGGEKIEFFIDEQKVYTETTALLDQYIDEIGLLVHLENKTISQICESQIFKARLFFNN